jgi:hypothetical protein
MDGMPSRRSSAGWRAMAWASLALAAIVAKVGADSVIAQVTPSGQYRTSTVYGPEQMVKLTLPTGTFNAWTQASRLFGDLWVWLSVQAVGDLFFVAGYVGLSAALIRNTMGPVASGGLSGWLRRWGLLAALAVVNVVQVVLSIAAFAVWIRSHDYVPYTLVWWLTAVVLVKWPLAIIFVTVMAYRLADSREASQQLKRIAFALKEQRFSLVIVALLGVIAIARGSDVLEQMPDVQRAWLTWPPSRSWRQLGFALAVQALLAVLLALLSAMRTQRARDAARREDYRAGFSRWPWALMAVAVPVVALAMSHFGDATVSWYNVLPIPVLAGIVFLTSWLEPTPRDRVKAPDCASDGPDCARNRERAEADREQRLRVRTVRTTGDMLAVAVIALTGLGLVRSFTAAAMVVGPPYRWVFMMAVAVGGVVAVSSWVVAHRWVKYQADRFDQKYRSTGRRDGTVSPAWLLAGFAVPFAVADVLLVFVPMWATHLLGVLATTVIALGTLAVGLAVLAYLAQSREPAPLFRLLRLKSTPVISLVVIVTVAGTVLTKSSEHDIRSPTAAAQASSAPTGTESFAASLQQWLHDPNTTKCAVPVTTATAGSHVRVEPMVLVAASGGGIRAAWWTVKALEKLAATPCGQHSVFAASGVSGGSVGLAIMDTTPHPDAGLASIAGPDGLAAAIDGMLLRDTIDALTGLDFTAADMPAGQRFPDRAALLEQAWQNEDPALAKPFPMDHPLLPWRILMNTTAVSTGCRAVIADRLIAPEPVSGGMACDLNSGAPLPDSYDLFARLPCLRGIDTITAALLSARFPYITPSGVVNGCGNMSGKQVEQYVDGGYADSTGLATIAGLAPELMAAVRQYNTAELASTVAGHPVTLVVPVTVYLGNSPQPEPGSGAPPGAPSQMLIPVASSASAAHAQLDGSTALLQQVSAATADWMACAAPGKTAPGKIADYEAAVYHRCMQDQAAAATKVPQQLIMVVPREYPTVAAPLGWVLSAASQATLTGGVATEAASTCPKPEQYCPPHVGRLGDLLHLVSHTPSK